MTKEPAKEKSNREDPRRVASRTLAVFGTVDRPSTEAETELWPVLSYRELGEVEHVGALLDGMTSGSVENGQRLLYEGVLFLMSRLSDRLRDGENNPKIVDRLEALTNVLSMCAEAGLTAENQQLARNRFVDRTK